MENVVGLAPDMVLVPEDALNVTVSTPAEKLPALLHEPASAKDWEPALNAAPELMVRPLDRMHASPKETVPLPLMTRLGRVLPELRSVTAADGLIVTVPEAVNPVDPVRLRLPPTLMAFAPAVRVPAETMRSPETLRAEFGVNVPPEPLIVRLLYAMPLLRTV